MATFGERLKELRTARSLSQTELAKALGISKQAVSQYERGLRFPKDYDQIADYFNVDMDYLMGRSDVTTKILNPIKLGDFRIPVVATIAAGSPIYSDEHIIDYLDWDKDPHGDVFGLMIKGDSMLPRIRDGDIVIVDKSLEWKDGDIIVATVNGNEGTCKRLKLYSDGIALMSTNPSYEPIYFSSKEVEDVPVRIIGKVIEFRAKL